MKTGMLCIAFLVTSQHLHAQVLETEDSRPLVPGQVELGVGLEFQTSKEGSEPAVPFAFELGLTKRFTFLVEPVSYTSISPKLSHGTKGIGDLELTLFYQLLTETKSRPAISLSAEVKLPTSKDSLIGTGKTDFTPFFIASKTTGKFFTSLNLSYTFLGKPPGVITNNLFNYSLGTIFSVDSKSILFGEIYGNTSSFGGQEVPEGSTTAGNPELSGGETVGALGYGIYIRPELLISFGINYDNNSAFLFRPGIDWSFGGKGKKVRPH